MKASLIIPHFITEAPLSPQGGGPKSWWGHGATVPLLLTGSLLGLMLLLWCPVALRWPLRILIVAMMTASLWAGVCHVRQAPSGRRFRATLSVLTVFVTMTLIMTAGQSSWKLKRDQAYGFKPTPSSEVSPERVAQLAQELEKRGVKLAVLALPSFENVFPEKLDQNDLENSVEIQFVTEALERTSQASVLTWDMYSFFEQNARDPQFWKNDEVHLTKEGVTHLSGRLAETLENLGIGPGPDGNRKVVIMGNCFANQFAEGMRDEFPNWKQLRGLTVLGDEGRAPDSLFLFPDLYLKDTEWVIWMMPYQVLRANSLAPLNAHPNLVDSGMKTATLRVTAALDWESEEGKNRLKMMTYPNGLVNLTGQVISSEDFSKGDVLTVQGYGVLNRRLTPTGRIGVGKRIRVNLVPLEYYLSKNPKVTAEYLLNDPAEELGNQYWIHSWTFEP